MVRALVGSALIVTMPSVAPAQRGTVTQGGAELLVPLGARTVGMGQATTAADLGGEAIWWNPVGLARTGGREAAFHHARTVAVTASMATYLHPVPRVGVVGLGLVYMDLGESEASDQTGEGVRLIASRGLAAVAGFGTTFGSRVAAGVGYKFFRRTGDQIGGATAVVDVGAQFTPPALGGSTVGVALRNAGLALQVRDEAQADPVPTTYELGLRYPVPLGALDSTLRADLYGTVIDRPQSEGPGYRLGAGLVWRARFHARVGYAIHSPVFGSGPSLGFGVSTGRLTIDIARVFGDPSSALGVPPTYLSLRLGQ